MTLLIGDCIEQMRTLEADSVDAIVTDPPYGLEFMGKEWDGFGTPFGFQTWSEQWAREALRVLKPGGHLLAFGGTRMYHRLAAGIEDAGFEIRDTLMWLYGSGFPKSLDVSKAIDKAAGAEREVVGQRTDGMSESAMKPDKGWNANSMTSVIAITAPSTEAAKKWQGWGTALKPAVEPIVLARKPLIGTVAANVLTHGTGALNIDASRIGTEQTVTSRNGNSGGNGAYGKDERVFERVNPPGRWPANILLDEEAAAMLDEQSGDAGGGFGRRGKLNGGATKWGFDGVGQEVGYGDTGGASRFFYVAKASRSERNAGLEGMEQDFRERDNGFSSSISDTKNPRGNIHPTVKPVALMKYLIRLVVPKGGTVLDPFLGSGTTAVAAIEEGVEWIGCERELEYVEIIKARVAAAQPGMGLALEEER
jgi:site-specific DNA-methyltransferase (adenine-specific)